MPGRATAARAVHGRGVGSKRRRRRNRRCELERSVRSGGRLTREPGRAAAGAVGCAVGAAPWWRSPPVGRALTCCAAAVIRLEHPGPAPPVPALAVRPARGRSWCRSALDPAHERYPRAVAVPDLQDREAEQVAYAPCVALALHLDLTAVAVRRSERAT